MTPNIPAIETIYGGNRYRSRTEAKWAVFFDLVKVPFEYEPQGVDLPSGKYLPDFWLPTVGIWFEVKGTWDAAGELRKYGELAAASKQNVVVAAGQPQTADNMVMVLNEPPVHRGLQVALRFDNLDAYAFPWVGRFRRTAAGLAFGTAMAPFLTERGTHATLYFVGHAGSRSCDAELQRAGFSRFEHGETGAPRQRAARR